MSEIEQQLIEPIPNFEPDQLQLAMEMCMAVGVAKISGMISSDSLTRLVDDTRVQRKLLVPATELLPCVPEMEHPYNVIANPNNFAEGMEVTFDPLEISAFYPDAPGNISRKYGLFAASHTDNSKGWVNHNTNAALGLTFILPITGPRALFAAGRNKFVLAGRTFIDQQQDLPEFAGMYGPGDVMLLRQEVSRLNGQFVALLRTSHRGISEEKRLLVAMDFSTKNLWLPGFSKVILDSAPPPEVF